MKQVCENKTIMNQPKELAQVSLHEIHQKLGARLVPFAGYSMPVQYKGVIDEHQVVRKQVGIFDVSHMGLLQIEGPDTQKFLNHVVTKDLERAQNGQCVYALLCHPNGGTLDDLIVYKKNPEFYLAVLNAGNKHKDLTHLQSESKNFRVQIRSLFDTHSILAVQGPKALELLKRCGMDSVPAPFYWQDQSLAGTALSIARTGYTGEEGAELFLPNASAEKVWNTLLDVGAELGAQPCGLGARDTLRLEMGYSLYGHELNDDINPLEAGLGWAVSLKTKNDFIGSDALRAAAAAPQRKLVCLKHSGKQAPRQGMNVISEGCVVGQITSGSFSPTLGHAIGMALVTINSQAPYSVDIRNTLLPMELCSRPFIRLPTSPLGQSSTIESSPTKKPT